MADRTISRAAFIKTALLGGISTLFLTDTSAARSQDADQAPPMTEKADVSAHKITRTWLEERNRRTLRYLGEGDANYRRDLDGFFEGIANDVLFEIPFSNIRHAGKAAMRRYMDKTQGIIGGNTFILEHVTIDVETGTTFSEVSSTPRIRGVEPITIKQVFAFRWKDGLLVNMREYFNEAGLEKVEEALKEALKLKSSP
jgi:ketosteroid isomerase-like protein